MSETPYTPPKANVSDPAELRPRRPILIWITQAVALLIGVAALFNVARLVLGDIPLAPSTMVRLAIQGALGALGMVVLVALIRPESWARWPTLIFVICISGLVYLGTYNDAQVLFHSPGERLGAGIFGMVLLLVFFLYPLRLYSSKAVRRFFETKLN
jgi:hypothetical protein